MKKILSLVLVLVMLLGCLGMTASATDPVYPPVTKVTVNGYSAGLSVSGNTITYNARVPGASIPLSNATLIVYPSTAYGATNISCSINNTALSTYGTNLRATGITLSATNQLTVNWTKNNTNYSQTYTLNVVNGTGNAGLSDLDTTSFNNATVTFGSITVGGVTRYTASVQLPNGTSASALSNLELQATPLTSTSTFKLDGSPITGNTFTANFTAQTHTLTVTDGNDSRDYLLSACAPDADGNIKVYLGIRTWLAIAYDRDDHPHFDYEDYGGGNNYHTYDSIALSIDPAGSTYVDIQPDSYSAVGSQYRPVFSTYEEVTVPAGSSVMTVLSTYAGNHSLTLQGSSSYLTGITYGNNTLGYGCNGWGDGWMYLVRYANTDVTTDLPNLAANNYIVTGGQYIDWIYTCAYGADFGYSMW